MRAALRLKQLYQELQRSEETKQYLLGELSSNYDSAQVIGQSAAMKRIFELLGKLADVDSPVLINGPTGAGKELVARAIHANSRRRTELAPRQTHVAHTPNGTAPLRPRPPRSEIYPRILPI